MSLSLPIKIMSILVAIASVTVAVTVGLLFYSVAQLSVAPGEVKIESSPPRVELTLPLFVSNRGPFPITDFSLSSRVQDEQGELLAEGATGPLDIPPGTQRREISHGLTIDLAKVKKEVLENLLLRDQKLWVDVQTSLAIQPFFKFSASPRIPLEWGAPVANLRYGNPEFAPHNRTHILLSIPISFENNSPYTSVEALVRLSILDEQNQIQGGGEITILAPPKSPFKGDMRGFLSLSGLDPERLLFKGAQLSYRVLVEGFVGDAKTFSEERPVSLEWKAPLANFRVRDPQLQPHNDTALRMEVPISFVNQNQFIDINIPFSVSILNATTGQRVGAGALAVTAPSGSPFSETITSFLSTQALNLKNLLFNDAKLEYDVLLEGRFEVFDLSVKRRVSFDWGAPLNNLQIGDPQLSAHNSTALRMEIPISFTNRNSWLDVNVPLTLTILNATTERHVGSGSIPVKAPPGGEFKGTAEGFVKIDTALLSTIMFDDALLRYTVVFEGQLEAFHIRVSRQLTYRWGAPIKDLRFGKMQAQPKNITHSDITVPLSFENNSPFLELDASIMGEILNAEGVKAGVLNPKSIKVPARGRVSEDLQGSLRNEAITEKTLTLKLTFKTQFGEVAKEVLISA